MDQPHPARDAADLKIKGKNIQKNGRNMTEKELKKLGRSELLELLILQTKRTEELELQVEELTRQLQDRQLTEKNAGTLAEAAMQVNGVFEAADAAAKQYVENIRACSRRCDAMLEETKARCAAMEQRAKEKMSLLRAAVDKLQVEWEKPGAAEGEEK